MTILPPTSSRFLTPLLALLSGVAGAAGPQPDFQLLDVNTTGSERGGQMISPRDYQQQISVYYFGREWWGICQSQFGSLNTIANELQGITDLPVRVVGIHDLGESFDSSMYSTRSLTWLREDETNRPWRDWVVPVSSRPAQEVRWRDVIILDANNEFVAVQNLTDEALDSGANRDQLKNTIRAAATISDVDLDGIPDRWEFDALLGISNDATDRVAASGLPALLAYAFSQPPLTYDSARKPMVSFFADDDDNYPQEVFRRRLGGEGERLEYRVQISDDASSWRPAGDELIEMEPVNPWDGTGTEIVTMRAADPMPAARFRFARVSVEVPL